MSDTLRRAADAAPAEGGSAGLSDQQKSDFARDGYLILRGLFGGPEMEAVDRWTRELAAEPEISSRHWVYHEVAQRDPSVKMVQRIENFCPFHGRYDHFIRRGKLTDLVSGLFGEPAVLFKEKINFKMPGGAGFKAHQDQQAGWGQFASLFITALVGIDAATIENCCLEIAANRHKHGLLGKEWRPLDEAAAHLALKPIPTAPSDSVLFDGFVPHASNENLTAAPRRVLYLTYNRASEGDHRAQYYREKHASFPPDIDRVPGREYVFKV